MGLGKKFKKKLKKVERGVRKPVKKVLKKTEQVLRKPIKRGFKSLKKTVKEVALPIAITVVTGDTKNVHDVVKIITEKFKALLKNKHRISEKLITEILTVNGIRFTLNDGSWGLIRASSNKPSLVVVTESVQSKMDMKAIFNFIDKLLKETGKVGNYDQKI